MITYESICKKLGCEPKQCSVEKQGTEFDNENNPFDALTIEELDFLHENGYF